MRRVVKIVLLLVFMINFINLFVQPNANAISNSSITQKMNELKGTYYPGSYWNHRSGESYNGYQISNTPCGTNGYVCNNLYGGKQCYAFARHLANIVFGSYPTVGISNVGDGYVSNGWVAQKGNSVTSIEPGDIISFGSTTHTAICWYTSGSNIYVAECWGSSRYGCRIAWGYFNGNSANATLAKMKTNGLVGVWKHPANSEPIPSKPTITSVKILSSHKFAVDWTTVTGATSYVCTIVKAQNGFPVVATAETGWYSYTFDLYETGTYYAIVTAKNSSGVSDQSEWYCFNFDPSPPDAPVLSYEIDRKHFFVGEDISLSWNSVSGASEYEYILSQYPEGYAYETTNVKRGNTSNTYINFNDLPIGRYSVFIHAKNNIGSSPQSNWVYFTVNPNEYVPKTVVVEDNHIYAIYDYETNWDYARQLCEYFGGHLATVTSKEEDDLIIKLINSGSKDAYWLGGTDYKSGDYNTSYVPYYWITGEDFNYSNWRSGEPNRIGVKGNKEHYLTVRKSYGNNWNDEAALNYSDKGFILEIDMERVQSDEIRFANNKYLRFDKSMTWTEAKAYCESLGGHLVTYDSKDEFNVVWKLIDRGVKGWYHMGGQKLGDNWYWINYERITWNNEFLKIPLDFDGCKLMQYHNADESLISKFAAIKNSYFPLEEINCLGFVCEIEDYYNDNEPDTPPTATPGSTPTATPTPVSDPTATPIVTPVASPAPTATLEPIFTATPKPADSELEFIITTDKEALSPGETATVSISLNKDYTLAKYSCIEWKINNNFEYETFSGDMGLYINDARNVIIFALNDNMDFKAEEVFLTFKIKAKEGIPYGDEIIELNNVIVANKDFEFISATSSDIKFEIVENTNTSTPEPTATPNPILDWSVSEIENGAIIVTAPTDTPAGEENYLYVAKYTDDGILEDIEIFRFTTEAGRTEYVFEPNRIVENENVLIMLWDGAMRPLI